MDWISVCLECVTKSLHRRAEMVGTEGTNQGNKKRFRTRVVDVEDYHGG